MINWLYKTIVVNALITYASFVWWPKLKQASTMTRLGMVGIEREMRTTPISALETLLNLLPKNFVIMEEAKMIRFSQENNPNYKYSANRKFRRIHGIYDAN